MPFGIMVRLLPFLAVLRYRVLLSPGNTDGWLTPDFAV